MVNSRQIGYASVRACREWLDKKGYIHTQVELTGRFRKYKDAFSQWFLEKHGMEAGFDEMALGDGKVWLIQVTTTKPKPHKPFILFKKKFPFIGVLQYVRQRKRKDKDFIIEYYKTVKPKRRYI